MSEIERIRAEHVQDGDPGDPHCAMCSDASYPIWPCDAAILLAERDALAAQVAASREELRERIKDALDCLPRALDGSRPFSLDQRAEVMLAIEALRAALAAAGWES